MSTLAPPPARDALGRDVRAGSDAPRERVPRLHAVATSLPPHAYAQSDLRVAMGQRLGEDRRAGRLLDRVYAASGIDTRHSVLPDLMPGAGDGLLREGGGARRPGTKERNARYHVESERLAACAARRAFGASGAFRPEDVTHLVTVSCTGFRAPGFDVSLVRDLGLDPRVERFHLGFMGCGAAFPALRLARSVAAADPDAVVLIVCVEICSLHFDPTPDLDSIRACSVFADGAAAALVSSRAPARPDARRGDDGGGGGAAPELRAFAAGLVPDDGQAMAWTIGDHGFEMVLSSYVPKLLGENLREALEPLRMSAAEAGFDLDAVGRWAVHPGGRAVLDKVEEALALPPEALSMSRQVLAECGNMSSATVLFVLERELRRGLEPGEPLAAAAFGPGLTIESALLVGA